MFFYVKIASNKEILARLIYKNGEIIEANVEVDGTYTIAHGGMTKAAAGSFKPVLKVYKANGDVLFDQADLAYYMEFESIELADLTAGDYYAEVALAASPQGPIKSAKEQGAFSVVETSPSKPEEDKGSTTTSEK